MTALAPLMGVSHLAWDLDWLQSASDGGKDCWKKSI